MATRVLYTLTMNLSLTYIHSHTSTRVRLVGWNVWQNWTYILCIGLGLKMSRLTFCLGTSSMLRGRSLVLLSTALLIQRWLLLCANGFGLLLLTLILMHVLLLQLRG